MCWKLPTSVPAGTKKPRILSESRRALEGCDGIGGDWDCAAPWAFELPRYELHVTALGPMKPLAGWQASCIWGRQAFLLELSS